MFVTKEDLLVNERTINVKGLTLSEVQETKITENLDNDCCKTVEIIRRIGEDGTMMVKTQTVFRNGLEMDSRETSTLDEEERDQFNRLWNQNWTKKAK